MPITKKPQQINQQQPKKHVIITAGYEFDKKIF